jgi:hypothetical protein
MQARATAIDKLVQDGDLETVAETIGPEARDDAELERQLAELEENLPSG